MPPWPQANGEVERVMRTIKKTLQIAVAQGVHMKQELFQFLHSNCSTSHCSTATAPATIMSRRQAWAKLLQIDFTALLLHQYDEKAKTTMKQYTDQCR